MTHYDAFATGPGLGALVIFIVTLVLGILAVGLMVSTAIATVICRRGSARNFASFLAALDEGDVVIQHSGPLCCIGYHLYGEFTLTVTERPKGRRDITFRSTANGATHWVHALRVQNDDIGQPLSRAWIKLCRLAKSERREQASA